MKKIFISGGAGFIGSELGKFLLKKEFSVQILDNLEYGYRDNFEDNIELKKSFVLDDVRCNNFEKYLEGVDTVVHLAGISSLPECESNPKKTFDINTTSVANVLDACRKTGVRRFIFSSTSAVYENNSISKPMAESDSVFPNLMYSVSKHSAENICRSFAENYGMDIIICRFFNVFGPHQDFKRKYPPFTSYLIKELISGNKPTFYNISDAKRDYIYIDDLMEYLYRMILSEKKYSAEVFNLASCNGYSTLEIAKTISEAFNTPLEYDVGDPIKFWDKYTYLFNPPYELSRERVKKEVFKHCIGCNKKIVDEFQYKARVNLFNGICNIIEYQKKHI